MAFKRFRSRDAYPALYVGAAVIAVMVMAVFYAAVTDDYSASIASMILLGTLLVFVFGFSFLIGIKHKETVYPKANYVDYYENGPEFCFAMISHVVFIAFGMYVIGRAVAPTLMPKLF